MILGFPPQKYPIPEWFEEYATSNGVKLESFEFNLEDGDP